MDAVEFEQRLRDTVPHAAGNAMVTRWVLVAEVLDNDGDRAIYAATSEDARAWDTLGLLDFASTRERNNLDRED